MEGVAPGAHRSAQVIKSDGNARLLCYNIGMLENNISPEKKQSNRISLYENGMQLIGFNIKTEGKPSEFKFFVLQSNQKLDMGFGNSRTVMTLDKESGSVMWESLERLKAYSSEKEAEAVVGSKRVQTTYL